MVLLRLWSSGSWMRSSRESSGQLELNFWEKGQVRAFVSKGQEQEAFKAGTTCAEHHGSTSLSRRDSTTAQRTQLIAPNAVTFIAQSQPRSLPANLDIKVPKLLPSSAAILP